MDLYFLTCNSAPTAHFIALSKCLDQEEHQVTFVATGAEFGKLKELQVKLIDFNPENLDLNKEEVQIKLAGELVKICSVAKMIIVDVGHLFSVHFLEALAKSASSKRELPLVISYYENIERWVPGGYSEVAFKVIKLSQGVFFANSNLVYEDLYIEEDVKMELGNIPRVGVGYYPLEQAKSLKKRRLNTHQEARRNFMSLLKRPDQGEKILVYLGENNSVYFDQALLKFVEFIEEATKDKDLSNTIIIFQPHPTGKTKQEAWLNTKELPSGSYAPAYVFSDMNTVDALVLADAVAGRQSSMVYQVALLNIPYMQVSHKTYPDVLVRNGYPSATTASDFVETLSRILGQASEEKPEIDEKILKDLGFQQNWSENFQKGIETFIK